MHESLKAALARRLYQRSIVQGSMVVPAVPGMLDEYVTMCDRVFRGFGVTFTAEQLDQLRDILRSQLNEAFQTSPRSDIVITYDSPAGLTVNYHVKAQWSSLDAAYDTWIATREPPLFGTEPDAKVMSVVASVDHPADFPVLDLGAGTGRNALPLARRGHPVDAVEITPGFADALREAAAGAGLALRVMQRDIFAQAEDLRHDYRLIVVSEVATDFRSTTQLRDVCEIASGHLAPGGYLVMNAFLPRDRYVPDDAARELGQQCYSSMYTRDEVESASAGLDLLLESDESVFDYESTHLPPGAWPPTGWYERWISGQDVFDIERDASPIELRWLVFRKNP